MLESNSTQKVVGFSAFDTQLEQGANLIEASAGTGKTFSIAMLVLRFIVEKKLSIEQILVVTFTKAAIQELRVRIRRRLQDLRNYLLNTSDDFDEAFIHWASRLEDPQEVIKSITLALAAIDNAAIFTIHGFCQRMLRQYALESGQLFDSELTANLQTLQQSLAEDFWRKQLYGASPLKAALLSHNFDTPNTLSRSIDAIDGNMVIVPDGQDIDVLTAQIGESAATLALNINAYLIEPLAELVSQKRSCFRADFLSSFNGTINSVMAWVMSADKGEIPLLALQGLSFAVLTDAVSGNKIPKLASLSLEERKAAFLNNAGITEFKALEDFLTLTQQLTISLRLGLFHYVQEHLDAKKDALNVLSYDDLITRLGRAIDGDNLLTASLRRQFNVALIDEFQDTDQQQWDIFSGVYHTPEHYLYLIGDPKQAVYKFRGADIYSYLDAKKTADRAFTLEKNFRSAPVLIDSINHLYSKTLNPFLLEDIPYHPVTAGKAPDLNWLSAQKQQGLVLWYLEDNPDKKSGHWTSGIAKNAIRGTIVNEIIDLLGPKAESDQSLQPQDIAILVRGNTEAANYQWALQQAKVPAVVNSKQSVFDSAEAAYLQQLLLALERPADMQRLRQALVVPWFGFDGQAYDVLCRDDLALQQYVMEFQEYQQCWQQKGLMAMMKSLLADYQVLQKLSLNGAAERRITNLQHLLEMVQQAVLDHRLDIHKTIEWLNQTIQSEYREDGTELRLEQDEDAVNIVTIHSSKGLEYSVVFVPELWNESKHNNEPSQHDVVKCHKDGRLIVDLGSSNIHEHLKQERFESRAEELRLLYVAITRAAHRCYLPWATTSSAEKEDKQSAFAYLLKAHEGKGWRSKLELLAESLDGIEFAVIPAEQTQSKLIDLVDTTMNYEARATERVIQQQWRMSSYSSLAYLSQHEHELPQDKSEEPTETDEIAIESEAVMLPKGAHTGNVLHDLLENSSFEQLSKLSRGTEFYESYTDLRDKSCTRYGLVLDDDTAEVLEELLIRSVQAPLDADDEQFSLAKLDDADCLKEMAFYFSVNSLQTQSINQLLVHEGSYQSLSMRQISGQLTGFIDLICKYKGRYYVMDYKSNSLAEYGGDSLQQAMRHHNYGLQYFIYSLVLHEYLKQRLPDYQYETHFGGVRYLFLRGMDKNQPMQGVFVDKPSLAVIEGLGAIFNGESC